MIIKLDMNSSIPIYIQLRNQIVMGIGKGDLKLGEQLPTVRQMAEDIGINQMTVNKAYGILKFEGYIEIDRRHGAKIALIQKKTDNFKEKMEEELQLLMTEASLKGYDKSDILRICRTVINGVNISLA